MLASLLPDLQTFTLDPSIIHRRLRARLKPAEFFGVLLAFAVLCISAWAFRVGNGYPGDFKIYLDGQASPGFYYGYWFLPVFAILKLLPFDLAYILWGAANILACLYAVRVFGGKPLIVLISYQLMSCLNYGQISGLIVGGLALCWWGMANQKWYLAGLGLLVALTKYQVGFIFAFCLIWYAGINWRNFIRMLLVPAAIFLLSLVVYPLWPLEVLQKISHFVDVPLGITLWPVTGAWILLLWVPALFLPLSRPNRLLALMCLGPITLPYFLLIDLLTLFAMPVGLLPLVGLVSYLYPFFGGLVAQPMVIIPLIWYLGVILPAALRWLNQTRSVFAAIKGNK